VPLFKVHSSTGETARLWPSLATWLVCALLLGPFLVYPVVRVLLGAVTIGGDFSPALLLLPWRDPIVRIGMRNALLVGVAVTLLCSLISLPLAYAGARLRFPGKTALTGLLLVPLLLPPLVGAVGLRQLLAREGLVNTLLLQTHLLREPLDFLLWEWPMIVVVASLHLFPLLYLNVTAAWANVDSSLEEAAENQGASGWGVFRTVTLPLLLPGYGAGALIVFIFALTDLGTPLIFNVNEIAAVQIYNRRVDVNDPSGFVLALWLTIMAAAIFWFSRRYLSGGRIATLSRGTRRSREKEAPRALWPLLYGGFGLVIALALLPHVGVILASFAESWTSTLLPRWTLQNYARIFGEQSELAANSIKLSLLCASLSMVIDVVFGFALAYALVRGRVWGAALLDTLAMLPLALPGLILAFGLLVSYLDTPLDPLQNAIPLLVISYAVRRLPYALRSVSAGLQQTSVTLEEAARNLGASAWQTVWSVTRPLVTANLIAAALLTFAFAVLEVSDSLILTSDPNVAPIANAIYQLTLLQSGGAFLACALGVIGMLLLAATFFVANRLLGRQLGALFRA
jgi:iron(III) transport system permease protein